MGVAVPKRAHDTKCLLHAIPRLFDLSEVSSRQRKVAKHDTVGVLGGKTRVDRPVLRFSQPPAPLEQGLCF